VEVKNVNDAVFIKGIIDFDVEQIFDCGQAFRFRMLEQNIYEGVAFGKYLKVTQTDEGIYLWPCSMAEYENIWRCYFDMDTDYSVIKSKIAHIAPVLKEATAFGSGIRILKQEPWEIIISFIISANNNIPRIQGAIDKLSEKYGDAFQGPDGKTYYSFPCPDKLAGAAIEDLRACGLGYRDKYIKKSAEMVRSGELDLNLIHDMNREETENMLLKLHGVGKKVADCIMLFAFSHMNAFPVDTWVKKVITRYFLDETAGLKEIQKFVDTSFGDFSGYVQQYLFYYIRELK